MCLLTGKGQARCWITSFLDAEEKQTHMCEAEDAVQRKAPGSDCLGFFLGPSKYCAMWGVGLNAHLDARLRIDARREYCHPLIQASYRKYNMI